MHARLRRKITAGSALAILTLASLVVPASAATFTPDDYCLGQCADILPPGQNGNATLAEILANQAFGTRPAHSDDQLGRYANLVSGYTGLTDEQIDHVLQRRLVRRAGRPGREHRPAAAPDVTIVRDKATGVPHITGTTRDGTEFGAGYAGAAGPAVADGPVPARRPRPADPVRRRRRRATGRWSRASGATPRTPRPTCRRRSTALRDRRRPRARRRSPTCRTTSPASTPTSTQPHGGPVLPRRVRADRAHRRDHQRGRHPSRSQLTDLVAIAAVVGGLFGGGGGGEVQSALVRLAAQAKYGATERRPGLAVVPRRRTTPRPCSPSTTARASRTATTPASAARAWRCPTPAR